ncbi:MAG TPA: glutamine-hydrolyzing carbamoyl-phosphate synthase small subunit [Cyclobacteriaceae bacterium]
MTIQRNKKRKEAVLLLEDGTMFKGHSIGGIGTTGGEICFNTGMTGYQEIYTDPSYFGQIIVNTTAHIGNYGSHLEEQESGKPQVSGIVVNYFSPTFSRKTADNSLQDYLSDNKVVGITDIDTRKLVRHIRSKGAMNAVISSESLNKDALKERLGSVPNMESLELSSSVTTPKAYEIGNKESKYRVAVLDLGIKRSILKNLSQRNVFCRVFNAKTSFEEMEKWSPDGYFISNGPGDPAATSYAVERVKNILESGKPLFGICLGHQILALSCNIGTFKMHHGHRGLNHPVKNLITGKSEITSQNHGFAVNLDDLKTSDNVELTHIDLNDNTVEGLRVNDKNAFSVQYHPESSPGPHDSRYLFDDFIHMLNQNQHNNESN